MSVAANSFQCATAPGVVFSSRESLHEHYKSEWHRYNLRRRAAGLAPIGKDVFDKVRQLAQQQESASSEKHKKQDHVASKNRPKEDEEEEEEQQQQVAAQEEEPEQEQPTSRPITQCFFCDEAHEQAGGAATVEDNLLHMHKHHGFVVHDLDSVVDLPRLLQYVSDKVHIGMLCLTCEREFRSPEACKAHMEAKGHGKIPWVYEDEVEEYLEYYHFKPQAEGGEAATMELDAVTGELILRQPGSSTVKRLGPGKEFRTLYREMEQANREIDHQARSALEGGAAAATTQNEASANAIKERSLQIYRGAGVLVNSTLSYEAKTRLAKRVSAVQTRQETTFHEYAFRSGYNTNWLIKHRKAGTNRGVGHGVHG